MSTLPPPELKPTAGLRVEIVHVDATGEGFTVAPVDEYNWHSMDQATIDAAYINQLLEEAEQRALHLKRPEETGDLMVDLGDLTRAKLGTLVQDESFELQVIDYIDTFNNAVIQGIPPFRAMRAMTEAFGLVLSNCLRAGLNVTLGAALIQNLMEKAKAASKHVKVITSAQRHN